MESIRLVMMVKKIYCKFLGQCFAGNEVAEIKKSGGMGSKFWSKKELITLRLDMRENTLTLVNVEMNFLKVTISLPQSSGWRVFVSLHKPQNSIEFLQ